MVEAGALPEDLADVAHRLTHPNEYLDPAEQVDAEYDQDAYPDSGADLDTDDALDLEDGMTDAALQGEQDAPEDEARCPECGFPSEDDGPCPYCGCGGMGGEPEPVPPEVDADGFTESDEGDYPLPGWNDLSPEQQQAAREQFRRFLDRQSTEPTPDSAGRRPDGSFSVFA